MAETERTRTSERPQRPAQAQSITNNLPARIEIGKRLGYRRIHKAALDCEGAPAHRLAALCKGFSETFADPDYLADARKLALSINKPSSGEALQAISEEVCRIPAEARE